MRRSISLVLCLVFTCMFATPILAADPDYWSVDTARQNLKTQDVWNETVDGSWTDGFMRFGDIGLILLFWYGKHRFGW